MNLKPRSSLAALALAGALLALLAHPCGAQAQSRAEPPLEDFVALASSDAKISDAAAARLAPLWRDGYASMVLDLARFFRPARPEIGGAVEEGGLADDANPAGRPGGANPGPMTARTLSTESMVRMRLMRFLSKQTGKKLGDDLKAWRKWSWTVPYEPHSEYRAFKARLYANVDPRMATFFEASTRPRIRLDEIDWGGVGVNGIPPLTSPRVVQAADAKFMGDRNVVFGIVVNGEARAYPKRILAWHEMALDTLGGVKLAVVYCTLCGTVIPYERSAGGREFTLGTSGLLYRSNKLMFDAETNSLWSTIEGRPVVGALAESEVVLASRPVVTTTWKEWRAAHPATTVLALDTGHDRDYGEGAAYRFYFTHDDLMFEVPFQDDRLKRKAEVLTLMAGADRRASPVALDVQFLRRNPVYAFSEGGVSYVVVTSEAGANRVYESGDVQITRLSAGEVIDAGGTAWRVEEDALIGPSGRTLPRTPARRTFWFAWFSQFPQTRLIR